MREAEPLEDVVHAVGLDLAARPRDEADGGLEVPRVALELPPVVLEGVDGRGGGALGVLAAVLGLGGRGLAGCGGHAALLDVEDALFFLHVRADEVVEKEERLCVRGHVDVVVEICAERGEKGEKIVISSL